MKKTRMKRVGVNRWGHIVYQEEETGKYYLDINNGNGEPDLRTCHPSNDPDGEPGWAIKVSYEIVNPISEKEMKERKFQFTYMMLSRLQSDCIGYLSSTDCRFRNPKNIWGKNVPDHIAKMKELWNKIPEDIKPEWLSWDDILRYEREMAD